MEARRVDPRDITFEVNDPMYRVHFWRRQQAPAGSDTEQMGYESYEHEIQGADVHEVIAWADAFAAGEWETYTLYLVLRDGELKGLARLAGIDPTAGP